MSGAVVDREGGAVAPGRFGAAGGHGGAGTLEQLRGPVLAGPGHSGVEVVGAGGGVGPQRFLVPAEQGERVGAELELLWSQALRGAVQFGQGAVGPPPSAEPRSLTGPPG